jgi:hypothetical protein
MPKAPFHCAYCGKPARKRSTTVHVMRPDATFAPPSTPVSRSIIPPERLPNKAACAPYTNGHVLAVSYAYEYCNGRWTGDRYIDWFTEWDGESWGLNNGIFCHAKCATDFAVAAFKAGYRMARKAA